MGQPGMQPSTSNGHIALHKFQDLFFITPTSRDSYVFVVSVLSGWVCEPC